jgi:hypothetical protein
MKALHRQQGAKHRKPALGEDGRCANCHILQPGTILFKKKKKSYQQTTKYFSADMELLSHN